MSHDNTADPKGKPADKPVDPSEKIDDDADAHVDKQLDKGLKPSPPATRFRSTPALTDGHGGSVAADPPKPA